MRINENKLVDKEKYKMKFIESDFSIGENSIKEFIRIQLSEITLEKIMVKTLEESTEIKLEVQIMDSEGNSKTIVAEYKNIQDKLPDQKIVMVKVSLLKIYNKNYRWGSLIGVRPTKLLRKFLDLTYSYEESKEILMNLYYVSEEKTDLLITVVKKELEYLNRDNINVYIGIPYCPTKCHYCSFASYELKGKQKQKYPEFIETLLEEIKLSGELLRDCKYKIESIYMGGGTPTILNEDELDKVLTQVKENIDFSNIKEFTVEAGRIDTLNIKKLDILKKHGVDRISINPQTFNTEILKGLNRYFSKDEFTEIFNYSKKLGFIINMDLIIGLPGESTEDILNTLETAGEYSVENLTIHMLALKKAAVLYKDGYEHKKLDGIKISEKIKELMEKRELKPYYLYRQKNSIDWGENAGYAIEGKESIFNIEMIEENQSTFGIGGGAISKTIKRLESGQDKIERMVNPKDPTAYILEMKERFEKKKDIF